MVAAPCSGSIVLAEPQHSASLFFKLGRVCDGGQRNPTGKCLFGAFKFKRSRRPNERKPAGPFRRRTLRPRSERGCCAARIHNRPFSWECASPPSSVSQVALAVHCTSPKAESL